MSASERSPLLHGKGSLSPDQLLGSDVDNGHGRVLPFWDRLIVTDVDLPFGFREDGNVWNLHFKNFLSVRIAGGDGSLCSIMNFSCIFEGKPAQLILLPLHLILMALSPLMSQQLQPQILLVIKIPPPLN